jgi:hypothetical protein
MTGILLYMLLDRGLGRVFGSYWNRSGVVTPVMRYMAQSRLEQILHAGRCIGARGRTTMTAWPMRIFGYSFANPHCKVDFPYAEASMEKGFEWWRTERTPEKKYLRNKAGRRRSFFRDVSIEFMKRGWDKMPEPKMVVHDETAYEE